MCETAGPGRRCRRECPKSVAVVDAQLRESLFIGESMRRRPVAAPLASRAILAVTNRWAEP